MNMNEWDEASKRPAELSGLRETVIADLVRSGLLASDLRHNVPKLRMVDESLRLFLPFLERFQVKLVPMERTDCPVFFCTGILKLPVAAAPGRPETTRSIPGGGQGTSLEKATISCLGELAERLSLCSLGDHDSRVFPTKNEQPQVDFAGFVGLSSSQEAALTSRLGRDFPKEDGGGLDWLRVSERRVLLKCITGAGEFEMPSFAVLLQESEGANRGALSIASSVGCAVWPSHEGARERALLELVERDAVALSWYNRLGITFLPKGYLREILSVELMRHMEAGSRRWGLYLLRTDLAVQVAMAVSHDGNGGACAFGSAAGWDVASACKSALEELLQSENALHLMDKSYPATEPNAPVPRQLAYARNRSILEDLPLEDAEPVPDDVLSRTFSYETLMQSCLDRHISIWEFDALRPDLNIPCVKLMSPELCTWEPRFGKKRLYESVVDWSLRARPASEEEFAARPFPF